MIGCDPPSPTTRVPPIVDSRSGQYAGKSIYHAGSLATSASSSCLTSSSHSNWSDASSQSSDDTAISAPSSNLDESGNSSYSHRLYPRSTLCDVAQTSEAAVPVLALTGTTYPPTIKFTNSWAKQQTQRQLHIDVPVAPELRQNPRRTSSGSTTRSGCPPSLVRQADRKVNFVDNLVDSSTQIVEAIWPTSSVMCRSEASNSVLPLRTFIQETLRRSRTSYSTLQVALYYLILIKPHVPEHDFTMEQPEDCYANRALQCGRRMFLAALILASKYLQDRNYSARAWSKISGLATQEINQNEMAFLIAVNWKLHVTNEVYNRWTECVVKFSPSQPPSPGGAAQRLFERQCQDFRAMVLKLTPELDNLEHLTPQSPSSAYSHQEFAASSPRSLCSLSPSEKSCGPKENSYFNCVNTTPKAYPTPMVMEPSPATVYTPGRLAPALGLLPTPRLTPQTSGFSTPAVTATSYLLGKGSSMGLAMAQASCSSAAHTLDRWPVSMTPSPQSYHTARHSSLATSVSTASSPDSMVSDSSRTSRSSSISSASSLASAPSTKLDVQARCRYAKLCSEKFSLRPTIIASVPEDYEENCITSSPETYSGPVGKDLAEMSMETPLARRGCEMDDSDAARALQELHNSMATPVQRSLAGAAASSAPSKIGSKRSRPLSIENSLQDNVREMLKSQLPSVSATGAWSDSMVRQRYGFSGEEMPARAAVWAGRKRVCCSTEAAQQFPISSLHPAVGGLGGPGMWDGILN